MMAPLRGQVAWVTGAGSGIGRATARALAEAGADVALTGRTEANLHETAALIAPTGVRVRVAPADVTDSVAVERAHAGIVQSLGAPEILVNNAGANLARRHWKHLTPHDALVLIAANLHAPFLCTLAVLPAMRARGNGLLVHVASISGLSVFVPAGPAYAAAKSAVRMMSATLNAEEGINGIRSVCINPGETETPIMDRRPVPPDAAARARMAQPEDVAAAIVFCATLPPRACVTELTITPTDNIAFRADAQALAAAS